MRCVSMPSRASTSLLQNPVAAVRDENGEVCQCPLGLVPHCYSTPSKT